MNKVELVGRLSRDAKLEYKSGKEPLAIANFNLAVNEFKKGEKIAYFINCVAYGKTAENLERFTRKGTLIGVTGKIVTGSYENKEGKKVYTTNVQADAVEFLESNNKKTEEETTDAPSGFSDVSFTDVDIPF